MVTSSAWRNSLPQRDWTQEKNFDIERFDFSMDEPRFGEQQRAAWDAPQMFCWLCGQLEDYERRPGPSWPGKPPQDGTRFGLPPRLMNLTSGGKQRGT
jgi:hypothetical protein